MNNPYNNNNDQVTDSDDLNIYNKSSIPLFKKNFEGPIQGEKVVHADRDDLSNKMSDIRLSSFNNQSNNFFQPYNPKLINIEDDISCNQTGKKTEFRDTINDRMFQSHPSQLITEPIGQIHPNHFHRQEHHIPTEYKNDRNLNSNFYQSNKFNDRDNNNNRLSNLKPLGNNSNSIPIQYTPKHLIGDTRIGISSNSYLDDAGNTVSYIKPSDSFIRSDETNNYYTEEQHYRREWDKNIMTIGRLPETNHNSRVNFRDKANERLQNLISLPKTSSLPVVPVYQQPQMLNNEQTYEQTDERKNKYIQQINELNSNCYNVINEIIPINTQL